MSSWWSLASRFSISSWEKDLERSSHGFCRDTNQRHPLNISEGSSRAGAQGSSTRDRLDHDKDTSPRGFPITHRLCCCLLAGGTSHAPPSLCLDRGVPVLWTVYPLQDGPDDTAGHRG